MCGSKLRMAPAAPDRQSKKKKMPGNRHTGNMLRRMIRSIIALFASLFRTGDVASPEESVPLRAPIPLKENIVPKPPEVPHGEGDGDGDGDDDNDDDSYKYDECSMYNWVVIHDGRPAEHEDGTDAEDEGRKARNRQMDTIVLTPSYFRRRRTFREEDGAGVLAASSSDDDDQ